MPLSTAVQKKIVRCLRSCETGGVTQVDLSVISPSQLYKTYAKDGRGWLYTLVAIPERTLEDFLSGSLTSSDLFSVSRVKAGHAVHFQRRQREYRRCERSGYAFIWLKLYSVSRRMRFEHIVHTALDSIGQRAKVPCSCKGYTRLHREFWRLSDIGGLASLKHIVGLCAKSAGESLAD
ncbi:unnamed protein product [Mycena citricolor]|uniref:Bacteriophage T5 Orf172 DNA-binding domain-containing protein n=1 Tax=Mycena citricolor TaxID=2018698 RepID=A0AAD2H9M0_9AGAR|nr:unnamed protein product [Mycena citricolor]